MRSCLPNCVPKRWWDWQMMRRPRSICSCAWREPTTRWSAPKRSDLAARSHRASTKAQQEQIGQLAKRYPDDADLAQRLLGARREHPPETDVTAWQKIMDAAPGDPEAGRRIFFTHGGRVVTTAT